MPGRESHDSAYKLLFSHPLMVRELLEGFVQEGWVWRRWSAPRLLQRLLTRRFGPLPQAALERLAAADAETLGLWAERLLDAPSLDEVLKQP